MAFLHFQDGGLHAISVAPGQTVVEAAIEADAPLRFDCMTGACGSCIARRTAGVVRLDRSDAPIVSADENAAGIYPTCLTRLESDASFMLDYPFAPAPSAPGRHAAHVVSIDRLASNVSRVVLNLTDSAGFVFQPGQYVRLRPPGLRVARAYSIASAPADLPRLELLIRHVPGGQVSGWLDGSATIGDRIALHGPLGGFALDDRGAKAVFVAGGTGLAPALSMIRAHAGRMQMLLCFGCTRREELFLEDELRALAVAHPMLEIRIALMEGASGATRHGTAVALLAGDSHDDARYHLCGPPGMVDAARVALRMAGVETDHVRAERFTIGG